MRLRNKLFLSIIVPLVATSIVTSVFITREAISAQLDQMERDGIAIAQLLGESSSFAVRVPERVEDILAEQMIVEATLSAYLVAVAEERGKMSPQEIIPILKDVAERTVLSEFWITDETGHAYLTNQDVEFTFSPNPQEQPQAYVFYPLLNQDGGVVIQKAQKREIDPKIYKYVGVSGIDRPRIVQVGLEAKILEELSQDINVDRLVKELTGRSDVASIKVLTPAGHYLAASSIYSEDWSYPSGSSDTILLIEALRTKMTYSVLLDDVFRVAVPIKGADGNVQIVVMVDLLTQGVRAAIQTGILQSIAVSLIAVLLGILISLVISRSITRPVMSLADAARSLERGETIDSGRIAAIASGKDELADLARVFDRMAVEVLARETNLKQQVAQLRIEIDESKKARQVAEITETDYFQTLRQKAKQLRAQAEQ